MLVNWLATAAAILIGDRLMSGIWVDGLIPALIAAAVLGLVNMTVKPVLLIITLPVTVLTLGLFIFVLNAMMLGLTSWFVPGFEVKSLMSGIGLALVVALTNAVASAIFGKDERRRRDRDA